MLENALEHDAPGLGEKPLPADLTPGPGAKKPSKRKCLRGKRYTLKVPSGSRVTVNGKRAKVRNHRVTVKLKRFKRRTLTFKVTKRGKLVKVLRYKVC